MSKPREVVAFAFKHPETGLVNQPQCDFYDTVMMAVARLNALRFFFYGGAIRGGKTYVCLFIFLMLARLFPKSRWHVFRSDFPELEDTTIPSMEKLIGTEGKDFVWKRKSSNYHVLFSNGSKIFFKSENLMKDPDLKWMLGLETNGILIEQMEGTSERLLSRAIERIGSWYIPNMPPPLLFGTFNPTDTYVKKLVYDRFREGTLPAGWHYQEALPKDNPYVTADQWANWDNLDPISKAQLIDGIWKFLNDVKLFAYSFDEKKHVVDVNTPEGKLFMTAKKGLPVKLIFDFNVDPITCLVTQNDGLRWIKVLAEYRLRNSDIFELCERVYNDWSDYYLVATGDASGRARSALTKGNRTYVQTIQKLLHLSPRQMQFPTVNPSIANTRILMNSLFHKHPALFMSSACQFLIDDLRTVKVKVEPNKSVGIEKDKDPLKTHLLDNLRYYFWNYLRKFINM
jgi:hypothetical protein